MKNTKQNQSTRKLQTKTETLRILSGSDLERVVGGQAGTTKTSTCDCNGSTC